MEVKPIPSGISGSYIREINKEEDNMDDKFKKQHGVGCKIIDLLKESDIHNKEAIQLLVSLLQTIAKSAEKDKEKVLLYIRELFNYKENKNETR